LSMSETSVSWNSWEVLNSPLLVGSIVASPVSKMSSFTVSSSPNINAESGVSSVVESLGSSVESDALISELVVSHDKSFTSLNTEVELVGDSP